MDKILIAHTQEIATQNHATLNRKLALWIRNHRTRQTLKCLDQHLLEDVGLDQKRAESEARKPFWR